MRNHATLPGRASRARRAWADHRAIRPFRVRPSHAELEALYPYLTASGRERLDARAAEARARLGGRRVWSVNSTAVGGGVAELLRSLIPYERSAGVDAGWVVVSGRPAFFALTKRVHNMLHGHAGDGGRLGPAERRAYEATLRANAGALGDLVRPGDIVILHDPQTAGLVPHFVRRKACVIWRCHVGTTLRNDLVEEAWSFLAPYVESASRFVFTRSSFVPPGIDASRVTLIAPSIDPCTPKNRPMSSAARDAVLAAAGLTPGGAPAEALRFSRRDGGELRVRHRALVLRTTGACADRPLVLHLSRWDALKDPNGVIEAFLEATLPRTSARLMLAGVPARAVVDDPEAEAVLDSVAATWRQLPAAERDRVEIALLPIVDLDENEVIVNALQRSAGVIVKKSLGEGFGLGVTEALWKERPVVATRVGGVQDQIEHRRTGILVDDPRALAPFGAAVAEVLEDGELAARLGRAGRESVRSRFLSDRNLADWFELLVGLVR